MNKKKNDCIPILYTLQRNISHLLYVFLFSIMAHRISAIAVKSASIILNRIMRKILFNTCSITSI